MVDMLYKATKYMNVEDTMIAQGGKPKKRERQEDTHHDRGRKFGQMNDRIDNRRPGPPLGRTVKFTLLYTLLDQVFMQMRDGMTLTWSDKLKGDLNKRPKNKYFHFHRDHGYDTSECYDLKQ